jgi:hypothetical protein
MVDLKSIYGPERAKTRESKFGSAQQDAQGLCQMADSRYASTSTRLSLPCFRSPGNDRFEIQCWTVHTRISLRGRSMGPSAQRRRRPGIPR